MHATQVGMLAEEMASSQSGGPPLPLKNKHTHTHTQHIQISMHTTQVGMLAEEMASAQSGGPPLPLTVVFVERKAKCDDVAEALRQERIPAAALHGGLGQVCGVCVVFCDVVCVCVFVPCRVVLFCVLCGVVWCGACMSACKTS